MAKKLFPLVKDAPHLEKQSALFQALQEIPGFHFPYPEVELYQLVLQGFLFSVLP